MDTSIITLRAHHIKNLLAYAADPTLSDNEARYGLKFVQNTISIFNRILTGQTAVTITDDFDDLCKVCTEREADGCGAGGSFDSKGKGANFDAERASFYNLTIGTTYLGKDLLEKLGLQPRQAA